MAIRLLAVGTKMPHWVQQGVEQYSKRLPAGLFSLQAIPLSKRTKNTTVQQAIVREGEKMLSCLTATDHVVALDLQGSPWSTEQLAQQWCQWDRDGARVQLLVGGPDGLASPCLQRANQCWSLSALTLAHPVVRVVIAEQLYRAWTINNHHPYHRH